MNVRWPPLLTMLILLCGISLSHAVQPDEILADQALEGRARALSKELRCMVCQNQSIDDLDAPLARDLRVLVRERLRSGDSDRQVIDFLVARYGEFVLLKPRFSFYTALLWLGPAAIVLLGVFALFVLWRRASRRTGPELASPETAKLTASEQAKLSNILQSSDR